MTIWQAIILGLVQGITEFLPVSSSGHLVVARALLGACLLYTSKWNTKSAFAQYSSNRANSVLISYS